MPHGVPVASIYSVVIRWARAYFMTRSILLALSIRVKSDLGAATGIALQNDSVYLASEENASGRDKAIVLAGVPPRNNSKSMVLRGFEFLLNILTGPGSRIQFRTYVDSIS